METTLAIIFLVFGVLQIILFFKLWGMTNDVKAIKEYLLEIKDPAKKDVKENQVEYSGKIPSDKDKFKENDLVIFIKSGKQMRIKRITEEGKYSCYTSSGTVHEGDFDETELKLF